jgi:hypothetical protein
MHIFWSKITDGVSIPEWTLEDVYEKHTKLVEVMLNKGMKHLAPINALDEVSLETKKKELSENELAYDRYSVEEKLNGFHASAHKQGNEVKIFSEQKKELTSAFPTLVDNIKKLSEGDFIIDGELVPYDEKGNTLGRNELMKYVGAVKSGKTPDDSSIKLIVWDITYLDRDISQLALSDRIIKLKYLDFNDRVKEVQRKIANDEQELKEDVEWASNIKGSEGAVVKELSKPYVFGEDTSWRKYRKLAKLNVSVIKVIPKKRNLYNYLVAVEANKKFLDQKYIQDGKLILGHTFNTDKIFKEGDVIEILVEEVWRHEGNKGIHYSIHKPRVVDKTNDKIDNVDKLEDEATSKGVSVTHTEIDGIEVIKCDEILETEVPVDEGKEVEIKNFPERMKKSFLDTKGRWGSYVMQVHTRGDSLHYDIRHNVGNHLEGITLFGRSIQDRLPIETQRNNIRSTIKMPQPRAWQTFQGITHKGSIGATKHNPGVFTIISKGKFTIHEVEDHKIIIEYRSDAGKINTKVSDLARKEKLAYPSDLPKNLIDMTGKYSWHVAHIGEHHLVLFDKLKE